MTKFDIIIPIFNAEDLLPRCLNSILRQTHQDFRILAVDDNSTDRTLNILWEYRNLFPDKINIFHSNKNLGAAGARNLALSYTTADYISFVDSDDYLEPEYLERINDVATKYHPDMITTDLKMKTFGLNNNFFSSSNVVKRDTNIILPKEQKDYIYTERPNVTCKSIRSDKIAIPFPEGKKWEDFAFIIPHFIKSDSIYHLSYNGYNYTANPNGTTIRDMMKLSPRLLEIFDCCDYIDESLTEEERAEFHNELEIVKTINCINRLRDLSFVKMDPEQKKLLANYLYNLITIKETDFLELPYYYTKKNGSTFYRYHMERVEKLLDQSLQQESSEKVLRKKIGDIINQEKTN